MTCRQNKMPIENRANNSSENTCGSAKSKSPGTGYTTHNTYQILYFVLWPTNAQLFHKSSHSHMFRHYRVILRERVINTLPSYTSISNAAVGNTTYN